MYKDALIPIKCNCHIEEKIQLVKILPHFNHDCKSIAFHEQWRFIQLIVPFRVKHFEALWTKCFLI